MRNKSRRRRMLAGRTIAILSLVSVSSEAQEAKLSELSDLITYTAIHGWACQEVCEDGYYTNKSATSPPWAIELSEISFIGSAISKSTARARPRHVEVETLVTNGTTGVASAYGAWTGEFSAEEDDLVFLSWKLIAQGAISNQIAVWIGNDIVYNNTAATSASAILQLKKAGVYRLLLGNHADSDPNYSGFNHSRAEGSLDEVKPCAGGVGQILIDEISRPGFQVRTWLKCDGEWGYRLERILDAHPARKGWIGGCFYPNAKNHLVQLTNGGFRYVNVDLTNAIADVYAYFPDQDLVTKGRMSVAEYEQELDRAAQESRDPDFSVQWRGSPPTDPDSLGAVPLQPAHGPEGQSLRADTSVTVAGIGMSQTPWAWLRLANQVDDRWDYSLEVAEDLGVFVRPGDRIVVGNGVMEGLVEGMAALREFGGWRVVNGTDGLVFEATDFAALRGTVPGYVAVGPEAIGGKVPYSLVGDGIGSTSEILGPASALIFSDGFESGNTEFWDVHPNP